MMKTNNQVSQDNKDNRDNKDNVTPVYSEPSEYFPRDLREKYGLGEFGENKELLRIKAVMLGHAVGDALGVPAEFCTREELDENPITDMEEYGTYPVPKGSWSDDTSMALATLDSLSGGKIDYDEIMRNFLSWVDNAEYTPTGVTFDIGGTCLEAIRNYCLGRPATECGLSGEYSCGNGSLMRIHPLVLYLYYRGCTPEEAVEEVYRCSALTHAHPRAKIACGIYTFVLFSVLDNPCRAAVVVGLSRAEKYYGERIGKRTKRDIKAALANPDTPSGEKAGLLELLYDGIDICREQSSEELSAYKRELSMCIGGIDGITGREISREQIKSSGYVVDSIEAAIWCVLTTKDYKNCVLQAVNLGDDTDTVAAIAGGIAGAIYGPWAIPESWLDTLRRREYIENMCVEAHRALCK